MMNFQGKGFVILLTAQWRELVEREGVRVPSWKRARRVNYTRKNKEGKFLKKLWCCVGGRV